MKNPDLEKRLRRAIENARQATSDFDLDTDYVPPAGRGLKPASVLVAVTYGGDLVLTKRAARLKHHAGQIAFAGGRQDETDRDLVHTALREAHEEIGLDPETVTILGQLPAHETVTSYTVTPIIAMVPPEQVYIPEPNEVAEVFTVPLDHVLRLASYRIEGRHWRGQRRDYYTVPYGPFYIWGATARILHGLASSAA